MKQLFAWSPRVLTLSVIFIFAACRSNHEYLTPGERAAVKDSVTALANHAAHDLTQKGPVAWLNYFEDSPGFFMASDGALAFKDHSAAKSFIQNFLSKNMKQINLRWKNTRIDVLSNDQAVIGADFEEDIVLANGQQMHPFGYFTALADFDGASWKFRDLHWSIKKALPQ